MRDYLTPISDEIIEDGLGGIFGKKESKTGSKSLMLAGHLDEIDSSSLKLIIMDLLNSNLLAVGGAK